MKNNLLIILIAFTSTISVSKAKENKTPEYSVVSNKQLVQPVLVKAESDIYKNFSAQWPKIFKHIMENSVDKCCNKKKPAKKPDLFKIQAKCDGKDLYLFGAYEITGIPADSTDQGDETIGLSGSGGETFFIWTYNPESKLFEKNVMDESAYEILGPFKKEQANNCPNLLAIESRYSSEFAYWVEFKNGRYVMNTEKKQVKLGK